MGIIRDIRNIYRMFRGLPHLDGKPIGEFTWWDGEKYSTIRMSVRDQRWYETLLRKKITAGSTSRRKIVDGELGGIDFDKEDGLERLKRQMPKTEEFVFSTESYENMLQAEVRPEDIVKQFLMAAGRLPPMDKH